MNVNAAFEILQLSQGASPEEVNASYRRLLKEYHPDRNAERSDWSHQMTIRLTEAYEAIGEYLAELERSSSRQQKKEQTGSDEPDSGYSLATQGRIAGIYEELLAQIDRYYREGMHKIYLRQEGSMRQHYRAVLRHLQNIIQSLALASEMPGSSIQHQQITSIREFTQAFYENLLIKPKEHEVLAGEHAKAQSLYHSGSSALDQAIFRGLLKLQQQDGIITPGERSRAEQNLMYVLSNYPRSIYVPEALIKLYLLKCLSALCDEIEKATE